MQNPKRTQYHMFSMTEPQRRLINISEYENENLIDYDNRFKQTRDVVKNQVVTEFLDTFLTNQ